MALQSELKGSQQELDDFKKNISLVDYALSRGYQIDKDKSSVRHKVLHAPDKEESILVSRMRDGASHFLNLHDPQDRGSLIHFVMTRENASLGETRKILREFSGAPIFTPQQTPAKEHTIAATGTLSSDQQSAAMAEILKLSRTLSDPKYLLSRGLMEETLSSQAFKGRVFNNEHTDKAGHKHINTAFPIYNESGMISIEQRNTAFKGSLEGIPTGNGLFFSNNSVGPASHPLSKLVITEAPIDAMSHYQLHHKKGENTLYAATIGNLTEGRIELLQRAIDKRNPSQLVIAVDSDNAGTRFHINLLNKLEPARGYVPLPGSTVPVAEGKPKEIEFSAVQAGKYYTHLDISLKHSSEAQRNAALEMVLTKIGRLDPKPETALQADTSGKLPAQEKLKVEFIKTSPSETSLQVRLKNTDLSLAETLAVELRKEREQKAGIAHTFIVRHKPVNKDFNDDLKQQKGMGEKAAIETAAERLSSRMGSKPGVEAERVPSKGDAEQKLPARSVKMGM